MGIGLYFRSLPIVELSLPYLLVKLIGLMGEIDLFPLKGGTVPSSEARDEGID